jgi:isoleucyl-tRNA synthetase
MSQQYPPVPPHVDLPELERDVLQLWRKHDTFTESIRQRDGAPNWTFYEGPPTANGKPGTHHVEARVFKDVFPRFKTMRGFRVDRKAGWDCQGLHVEVGVEKELGVSGKRQIEEFGIAEFNAACRASVERHVGAFEEMTERMGYWVDMSGAYRTMDASYIESVWWSLKQIFDKGLLFEAQRVSPYCPRCETALSDHELAQGYETVVDPSVYVRFPLTSGPWAGQASMLVWTTTPWTLVSNTAVAVHPDVDYVVATDGSERLVVAAPLFESVLGDGWTVEDTVRGRDMEWWTYERPLDLVDFPTLEGSDEPSPTLEGSDEPSPSVPPSHFVVLGDYVTTEDGSGLVHQSPAFGEEDMEIAKAYDLPVVTPVQANGHFADDVRLVGGQFFKHADTDLVRELGTRGLLFRHLAYEHSYPHCWRCHTPLMYYALPAWYIRTTAVKDALLRANEATNWYPETIKWGRYGDWLRNNVDWSLSRTRYWGTPLPLWRNDVNPEHLVCVGSLAELSDYAGEDLSTLDPHRPFVDDVTFSLPGVPGTFRRVTEVIDAWYDSGSMPFAQWGYPHLPGSEEKFSEAFPAQFICEALDQTRGWFYSLMAIGTILFERSSYENVVCLGLLLAEDGRKMSKHLGNIVEPMPLMDEHGADALRWFMACSGSPWAARRVGHGTIQEAVRKVLLTYWNTVAFHALYARTNSWAPRSGVTVSGPQPVLDRWLVSQRHRLVRDVTNAFESFDTQRAGSAIAAFVDDLSNWYVRRSRRRFWDGDEQALTTLHETLEALTRLMAPLTPFITERVWQDLVRSVQPEAPDSVHLAAWPDYDESAIDDELEQAMQLTRRLVELGRAARAEAKMKTRQPLGRALIASNAYARLGDELRAEIAAELNVERVESFADAGDLVDYTVKANFRSLGKNHGAATPVVAAAIASADPRELAAGITAYQAALDDDESSHGGPATGAAALEHLQSLRGASTIEVAGIDDPVLLSPEDVIISERPREGWSVVNEHGDTIALDLTLTPRLLRAGLAREAVRLVQEARKSSGFDVSDRIRLTWSASDETATAVREHADLIAREVLAVEMLEADSVETSEGQNELGLTFSLAQIPSEAPSP